MEMAKRKKGDGGQRRAERLWLLAFCFLATAQLFAEVVHVVEQTERYGIVDVISDRTFDTGTTCMTVDPPPISGYIFTHWTFDASQSLLSRDPWGRALDNASFKLYETTTLTAHYLPATQDADGDGVADGHELYWYGDLSKTAASDTDGDGFTFAQEMANGTNPLFANERRKGPVSAVNTGVWQYNPHGYLPYTVKSDPEGVLFETEEEFVRAGTQVTKCASASVFAYWTIDGVEQRDAWGRARDAISFTMPTNAVVLVARAVSDATERAQLYWYGSTSVAMDSDTDGDGRTFAEEIAAGSNPLFADSHRNGPTKVVNTGIWQYNPYNLQPYTVMSDPENLLFPTTNDYVRAGAPIAMSANYASFAYWTVNGVEQRDAWGRARNEVGFTMPTNAVTLVAHAVSDEVKRAQLYWYGTTSVAMDSDSDGDGRTFAEEIADGSNPLFAEYRRKGPIVHVGTAAYEVNLQPYEQVSGAVVGGAYSQVFTSPVAGNAAMSATFGNGGAVWPVVADVNGDGLWDLVVCWGGGEKVTQGTQETQGTAPLTQSLAIFINVGTKGNPEFVEGGSQLAATANIDLAMNSPEKLAGLTLDVPPPGDALSATTNGTALLVSDSAGRIWYYKGTQATEATEGTSPTAQSLESLESLSSLSFTLQHKVWGGSHAGFAQGLRLAAVDWEDDGDLDCLAGTADGKLMLLRDPKVGRPTNLKALAGVDNVLLTWDPNQQSRIRGYRVYRAAGDGTASGQQQAGGSQLAATDGFSRIAQPQLPTYRDFPAVAKDGDPPEFAYKVSSVSRFYTAGNSTPTESESMPTEAVRAELGTVRFFWNDVAVKLGEQAAVMLSIENSMNYNVAGKLQTVAFDPAYLSFVKVVKTGLTEGVALSASCADGLLTISMTGGTLAAGGGKFLTLVFDTVKAGTTTVGEATVSIVALPGGGQTDVPPYSLGDVNGDGKLDERDVREFVKVNKDISPSGRKPTANQVRAGDFTGDGKIGAADVQPFIAFMASKGINVKLSNFLK